MYEFTMKGAWFRWSALDTLSRTLFAASMGVATASALPIIIMRLNGTDGPGAAGVEPWMVWWMIACFIISGLFWWRFSLRQDELFNRVQNWTIAMSGSALIAALTIWALLSSVDIVPQPSTFRVGLLYLILLLGFWFAGVRRWV